MKKNKDYVVVLASPCIKEREYLQQLLNKKLYHHWRVERMTAKARRIIRDLFVFIFKNPEQLPYTVTPEIRNSRHHRYMLSLFNICVHDRRLLSMR